MSPTRSGTLLTTALIAPLCVSYHSIFLLTALLLHLMLRDRHARDGLKAPAVLVLESLLGLTIAIGLHISFDRGVATAVAFGAAYLPLVPRSARLAQPGRIALATFGVATAIGALIDPMLSLSHYVENLTFLASTAAQWRYPWSQQTITLTGTLIFLAAAAWTLAIQAWRHPRVTAAQQTDLIVISVLTLFLLRIGTNRADISHILIGLSGPLLMVAWWHAQPNLDATGSRWVRAAHVVLIAGTLVLALPYKTYPVLAASVALSLATLAGPKYHYAGQRYIIAGLLFLPIPLLAGNALRHARHDQFKWTARLIQYPDNATLSSAGVRWAAASLRAASVTCVFDLSNNGLIQALVQKPACSRITYPVYGGSAHEAELVDALAQRQPTALVYSSSHWAYSIDQKPMPLRFPLLDRYIRENYPIERCAEGYCVRLSRS
jgi:hypothetical protein